MGPFVKVLLVGAGPTWEKGSGPDVGRDSLVGLGQDVSGDERIELVKVQSFDLLKQIALGRGVDLVPETQDMLLFAGSEDFLAPLRRRMGDLGIPPAEVLRMTKTAFQDGGWRPVAALDAVTRFVATIVEAKAVRRGPETSALIEKVLKHYTPA